jgi:hypothetical protein
MSKTTEVTPETIALAIRCARFGARAVTIGDLIEIPAPKASAIYRQVHGRSSPSGMIPADTEWYFKSPRVHKLSDIFLATYVSVRAADPPKSPDEARKKMPSWFISAYEFLYTFVRSLYQSDERNFDPILDAERALLLCKHYESHLSRPVKGAAAHPPFHFLHCTTCGAPTIAQIHKRKTECSICPDHHRRGRTPRNNTLGNRGDFML